MLLANLTVQLDKLSRQLEASQSEATKQKQENEELQSILQAMEAGQSASRGENMWSSSGGGARSCGLSMAEKANAEPDVAGREVPTMSKIGQYIGKAPANGDGIQQQHQHQQPTS